MVLLFYTISEVYTIFGMVSRILSQKSLRDRILVYLGTLPKDKNGFVKIPFTQTALAEHLGVNRSALSRELGRMQKEELLTVEGKKINLLKQ